MVHFFGNKGDLVHFECMTGVLRILDIMRMEGSLLDDCTRLMNMIYMPESAPCEMVCAAPGISGSIDWANN